MIRIIVSGTRAATQQHIEQIRAALLAIAGRDVGVLAHGGAPGVDLLTAALAVAWGWQVKPMPAQWTVCAPDLPHELGGCPPGPHRLRRRDGSYYCPLAGPRRNQQMVDLSPRAHHVVVFPASGPREASRGTWDLHDRALAAGLNVHPPAPLEVGHG